MYTRIKSAWLVLTGKAYAVVYASHHEKYLYWKDQAEQLIKISKINDPLKWDIEQ